jgi:hypothetical protein
MEKKLKIVPPRMPNFVRFENFEKGIDIKEFTEEEAVEFSELMKTEFMKHYKKKVKENG